MKQLSLEIPTARFVNDKYDESLSEYNKLDKKTNKTFLCFCKETKQYYVSIYFSREFLEDKKVTIVK